MLWYVVYLHMRVCMCMDLKPFFIDLINCLFSKSMIIEDMEESMAYLSYSQKQLTKIMGGRRKNYIGAMNNHCYLSLVFTLKFSTCGSAETKERKQYNKTVCEYGPV